MYTVRPLSQMCLIQFKFIQISFAVVKQILILFSQLQMQYLRHCSQKRPKVMAANLDRIALLDKSQSIHKSIVKSIHITICPELQNFLWMMNENCLFLLKNITFPCFTQVPLKFLGKKIDLLKLETDSLFHMTHRPQQHKFTQMNPN